MDKQTELAMMRAGAAADPFWRAYATRAIKQLAKSGRTFTAADVWAAIGDKAKTAEPRALGAMMKAAARAGVIVQTGEVVMAKAPGANARWTTVWVGVRK